MRILSLSLKNRFTGKPDVCLWEETDPRQDVGKVTGWIVTSIDRPGHEWEYTSASDALSHYSDLANARLNRLPGQYMGPVPGKAVK